jgi:hypothetical protein
MMDMKIMKVDEFEMSLSFLLMDVREMIDSIGFPAFLEKLKPSTQNLSEEDRQKMIKMLEEWKL